MATGRPNSNGIRGQEREKEKGHGKEEERGRIG